MNKTLTCRFCGQQLYEREPTEPSTYNWNRRAWLSHAADVGTNWENDTLRQCTDGKVPLPREYCYYEKTQGFDKCSNPVKHEDIDAGHFACGVHMKKFLEDEARDQAIRKRNLEEKEREEVEAWELLIYQAAYDKLTAMDPELFPEANRPSKKYYRRHETTVEVDIVKLERWMRHARADVAS